MKGYNETTKLLKKPCRCCLCKLKVEHTILHFAYVLELTYQIASHNFGATNTKEIREREEQNKVCNVMIRLTLKQKLQHKFQLDDTEYLIHSKNHISFLLTTQDTHSQVVSFMFATLTFVSNKLCTLTINF